MDTGKNKSAAMTSEAGEIVAGDEDTRRPWHKPPVTRIEMKRTLAGGGSFVDGFDNTI